VPATLIIKRLDNINVPDAPGRWRAGELVVVTDKVPPWSSQEGDVTKWFTFVVTDKTVSEVNDYLDKYTFSTSMQTVAGPDQSGLRRISVRNDDWNANYSPDCDWTQEICDNIRDSWNEEHPDSNLIILDIPSPDYFQCEGTFTAGERELFETVVHQEGLSKLVRRSKWYVSPSGMTYIEGEGGAATGTAAQLSGILKNRTLD
jgi:hypothetical protein